MKAPLLRDRQIYRTVYKFGSTQYGLYGDVVLGADGSVRSYFHPNERRYRLRGDCLMFLNESGAITSELRQIPGACVFLSEGDDKTFLLPTLVLGEPTGPLLDYPPILVNSIPKAGTYLVSGVLRSMGGASIGLHLGSHTYDDNRGIGDREMHRAPQSRRHAMAASTVLALLARGEYAVGHIEDGGQLATIDGLGVVRLNCARDLRDVLVSLYRFKLNRVDPLDAKDRLWRTLPEESRFQGFLLQYAESDIAHLTAVASSMAGTTGALIRLENLLSGNLSDETKEALNVVGVGFMESFDRELPSVLGAPTSTYSGKPSDHRAYWTPETQQFYEESGLAEVNRSLGYCDEWGT